MSLTMSWLNTPEMRTRYVYLVNGYYNIESSIRNTLYNITYYLPYYKNRASDVGAESGTENGSEMVDMSAGKNTDEYFIYPDDDINVNETEIDKIDKPDNSDSGYNLLQSISLATSVYFTKPKTDGQLENLGFYPLSRNMFFKEQPWNMFVVSSKAIRFDILEKLIKHWKINNLELDIVSSSYSADNYSAYQKFVSNLKNDIEKVNLHNAYLDKFDRENFQLYQQRENLEHNKYWRQYTESVFITILDEPTFDINKLEISSKLVNKKHYLIILKESFDKVPDFVEYIALPSNQMKKFSKIVGHQYPNLNESNMQMVVCHPYFQEIVNQINFIRL